MPNFDAKAQNNDTLRDHHNALVDQLNRWTGGLKTTDFIRTSNSTSFLGSTGTSTNSDRLDSLHSTDFVRSTTLSYSESTWLPVLAGGTQAGTITLAANSTGRYIRQGHVCTIYCSIEITGIAGSSGSIAIGGFPYTAVGNGQSLSCVTNGVNWGTGATAPTMLFGDSTNRGNIYGQLNNGAWVAANISGLSTSDAIKIQGSYIITT